jgi:hypothetical protein
VQVAGLPENLASVTLLGRQMILKYPFRTRLQLVLNFGWLSSFGESKKLTEAMVNANIGIRLVGWTTTPYFSKMLPKTERLYWMQKRFTNWSDYFECWWCQISKQNVSDMLKNKNDEVNFENIMTSELYKVTWWYCNFIQKQICMRVSFSPDGNYIMLTTIKNHSLYRSFESISFKIGDLW